MAPSVDRGIDRRAGGGVLSLSLVIIGLDNTILNVALPTLQDEFRASASRLQWMVDAHLLVFAGLLLVFGTPGDRFGRKLALQAGVSIFGVASLGALVADSAGRVIAVRALMGAGAALIMPATLSIVANVFTGEQRGTAWWSPPGRSRDGGARRPAAALPRAGPGARRPRSGGRPRGVELSELDGQAVHRLAQPTAHHRAHERSEQSPVRGADRHAY